MSVIFVGSVNSYNNFNLPPTRVVFLSKRRIPLEKATVFDIVDRFTYVAVKSWNVRPNGDKFN